VGAAQDPGTVLQTALEAALDLTEGERGFILIRRQDGVLEAAAARRRDGRPIPDPLDKISRTIVERAVREERPLCVDEARQDAGLQGAPSVNEMRLRAVLCTPFRLEGEWGAFYLDNRFAAGVFNAATLRLLNAFAGPVAMILRHARLQRQLSRTVEALSHANRDLDSRLRDRTEEVARLEGQARHEPGSPRSDPFPEILGRSPALIQVLGELERAARGDFPVLLSGESGTGKDLAARALHRASARGREPFVPVGLAGLNPALLEAELFGVLRGAFTGAEERQGLLASAGGGTLFLDGLDSLPFGMQPKLLRVLEDGSFRRVGGGAVQICRARIVAASRADLAGKVREGSFREDLYYRVRVLEIVLPPLRQRAGDRKLLLRHFLAREAERMGVEIPFPEDEELRRLEQAPWPGNVRELANFATRWAAHGGRLPREEWDRLAGGEASRPATLQAVTDARIREALEEAAGNKAEAARRLGISRRTLYNRLASLEE